jgi:hypothetical protein
MSNTTKMRHQLDRSRPSDRTPEPIAAHPVPPGCVPVPPEPPKGTSTDQLVAWKQQQEAAWTANMPALTVCPPWCDEVEAHAQAEDIPGGLAGDAAVQAWDSSFTAAEARSYAAALIAAADRLDEITGVRTH